MGAPATAIFLAAASKTLSSLGPGYIDHWRSFTKENVYHHRLLMLIGINITVDQAHWNMEEVARADFDRIPSTFAVIESKPAGHEVSEEVPGPVMVPAGHHPASNPRAGKQEIPSFECLISKYPLRGLPLLQFSTANDFYPFHGYGGAISSYLALQYLSLPNWYFRPTYSSEVRATE